MGGNWMNLNSYWRNIKEDYDKKSAIIDKAMAACENQDKAGLQAAYDEYMSDPIFEFVKNPPKAPRGKSLSLESYGRNPNQKNPDATESMARFNVPESKS